MLILNFHIPGGTGRGGRAAAISDSSLLITLKPKLHLTNLQTGCQYFAPNMEEYTAGSFCCSDGPYSGFIADDDSLGTAFISLS